MNPAEFIPPPADWPRFVVGIALFLLPGIAAADRLLPSRLGPTRFLLAPVLSFTLLPMAAIVLNFSTGWRATPGSTALLAVAFTMLFGARRLEAVLRPSATLSTTRPSAPPPDLVLPPRTRWPAIRWLHFLAVVAVALLAGFSHALPHFPGPPADTTVEALPVLAARAADAGSGPSYPYPVHVDEHMHAARAAYVVRNGSIADPYTGERYDTDLFSLRGVVHERGFAMGLGQFSMLSGASVPMVFLLGPAVWAALIAMLAWALARPHPGALAAAALVAVLPTDTTFMGASFFVPIAFGLAWVLALALVILRGEGAPRIVAILLLVTGAFFIHFLAGGASLIMAVCASFARPGSWRSRVGLAAVAFAPLIWVGPALGDELAREFVRTYSHSVGQMFFGAIGWPVWLLFIAGTGAAFALAVSPAHRTMAAFGLAMAVAVAGALLLGWDDLAIYYRSSHYLFLAAVFLAGHAVGLLRKTMVRRGTPAAVAAFVAVALVAVAASPGIEAHLEQSVESGLAGGYYRVHDEASWSAAHSLVAAGAGPGDVFLSEPWRAMLYNAVTGATPHTVLHPGSPPERGNEWQFYESSEGASAAWLQERGIDYVVSTVPPRAPHVDLGNGVYRIG